MFAHLTGVQATPSSRARLTPMLAASGNRPMSIETARDILLWCTVINYAVLLLWFLCFSLAHDWIHRLHARWFRLPADQFDAIHYAGMAIYKIGILLFNLVPYVALLIVGRGGS
jgi:hypothetical protein